MMKETDIIFLSKSMNINDVHNDINIIGMLFHWNREKEGLVQVQVYAKIDGMCCLPFLPKFKMLMIGMM